MPSDDSLRRLVDAFSNFDDIEKMREAWAQYQVMESRDNPEATFSYRVHSHVGPSLQSVTLTQGIGFWVIPMPRDKPGWLHNYSEFPQPEYSGMRGIDG